MGCVVLALLSIPQALLFGQGPENFGWYRTATGRLLVGLPIDQTQYLQLIEWFRGVAPRVDVAPFTGRSLAPWLAHFLPLDPATALLVVNVALLCAGCVALARLVRDLTNDNGRVVLAVVLWAASFPALWYTPRFTDAAAVGLIPVLLLTLYRRRIVLTVLLLVPAVWSKETALVFLAVAITRELLWPDRSQRSRVLRAGGWFVAGAAAYATREVLAGHAELTFAPWIPPDAHAALSWALLNLARPAGPGAFVLSALPAGIGLWLWLRRGEGQKLPRVDWAPLAVGAIAGLAIGLWTIWTALLDGRAAWMSLPMGAVLIATWRDPRPEELRPTPRARVKRVVLVGGTLFVSVFLIMVIAGQLAPSPTSYVPNLVTRLANTNDDPAVWSITRGRGDGTVDLTALARPGRALLVSFTGSDPVALTGPGLDWMANGPGARTGTVFVDAPTPPSIGVRTAGTWQITVRPVSAGLKIPAGGYQEWTGNGPAVFVQATGVNSPYRMTLESDDPDARIQLAGQCRLGECGRALSGDVVIPAGTEVIAVETTGSWRLRPRGQATEKRRLPGTRTG